ncbi:hypothetical protein Sjap_005160 [Stephania japonica]|uniref:Uncharacterized protein n=1 Tax=Stephania japonica TaxID=461633 RepID=A0AAP0K3J8_9MAGN
MSIPYLKSERKSSILAFPSHSDQMRYSFGQDALHERLAQGSYHCSFITDP